MSIANEPERRIPPSTLQTRLQDAREWRGYTQADIAEVLGVSRPTVSNYERGIGIRGMGKLQVNAWAAHCNVDVEWLKTGIEPDDSPTPGGAPGDDQRKLQKYNSHRTNVSSLFGTPLENAA